MARVVGGKYELRLLIGRGCFGVVYEASQTDSEEPVAVKIKSSIGQPLLLEEAKIYTALQGGRGIPKIMWSGTDQDDDILVLEFLGPDLKLQAARHGGRFSLKTVLMLAIQMIEIVEHVHSKGFLHRDIKPENFVIGDHRKSDQVYIIDFGLATATSYLDTATNLDPATNRRISWGETSLIGTDLYASCRALLGNEQSRRDDLESLGYVFMYLHNGCLPWQGLQHISEAVKLITIANSKRTPEVICKHIPHEFLPYFEYCRSLEFNQQPDYQHLRQLFIDWLDRIGLKNDGIFDWMDSKLQD